MTIFGHSYWEILLIYTSLGLLCPLMTAKFWIAAMGLAALTRLLKIHWKAPIRLGKWS